MLDLGGNHGIDVGMPVVTDQGLVGRISEVTDTTSKVLLITDVGSSVNALLQSNGLSKKAVLKPGQTLKIPTVREASTETTPKDGVAS